MSTSFGSVKGVALDQMGPGLRHEVYVNRFAGGMYGPCVQVTIGDQFVQLDRKAAKKLRRKLKRAAG